MSKNEGNGSKGKQLNTPRYSLEQIKDATFVAIDGKPNFFVYTRFGGLGGEEYFFTQDTTGNSKDNLFKRLSPDSQLMPVIDTAEAARITNALGNLIASKI